MARSIHIKLGLLVLLLGLLGCQNRSSTKTIRLAHGLPEGHPVHQAMVIFGQELSKQSKGELVVKIYPSNQLGGERECLELLQIGSLDIVKVSAYVMENFDGNYRVFNLPYVFKNEAHRQHVLDGEIGNEILNGSGHVRLKGLCYYDAGSRSLYTKANPVRHPKDLKGVKIRVMQSRTAMDMIEQMGGSPTPIDFGELYSALQQGVVDGAENNPPSFYTSKHYEICKFYTLNKHASVPDILVMGKRSWDHLSELEQGWVEAAAKVSVVAQRKLWNEFEQEAMTALVANGVQVIEPETSEFAAKVSSLHQASYMGEEIFSLFNRIQQVQADEGTN